MPTAFHLLNSENPDRPSRARVIDQLGRKFNAPHCHRKAKTGCISAARKQGAKIAAIFSVVDSCRKLGLPIRTYLADVLPGLADRSIQQLASLTPKAYADR